MEDLNITRTKSITVNDYGYEKIAVEDGVSLYELPASAPSPSYWHHVLVNKKKNKAIVIASDDIHDNVAHAYFYDSYTFTKKSLLTTEAAYRDALNRLG